MSEREDLHPAQEPDALSWRWITAATVGTIAITLALSLIAARAVHRQAGVLGGSVDPRDLEERPQDRPVESPVEFHLFEARGPVEGQRAQRAARQRLESWGFVDREAGIVRVPIDVVMDLVAAAQEKP